MTLTGTWRVSLESRREERFCAGGKHQTLAVDDANLYVASYFQGTITAISKKTRRARVLAVGVRRPVRLIVDDEHVYFASEADGTVLTRYPNMQLISPTSSPSPRCACTAPHGKHVPMIGVGIVVLWLAAGAMPPWCCARPCCPF